MTFANNAQPSSIASLIEEWADNEFKNVELPHQIKDVSIWHVLTVSEDWLRMLFTGKVEKSEQEIDATVDRLKYALKASLTKIDKFSRIAIPYPTPQKTIPAAYKAAHKLIVAGLEYSSMTRIFTSVHSGHSIIKSSPEKIKIIYSEDYDVRYSALEILNHGREPSFDISTLVYNNISGRSPDRELSEVLTKGVRVSKGRVVYEYQPEGIFHIVQRSEQREIIIPSDFIFDWGTGQETQALINALFTRCIYHLLSVNFAAEYFNIRGGFDSSLVLQITRQKLTHDLSFLADFPTERIEKFIDFLTYGNNSKTPDPALQPILPMKNGDLLIPCLHAITSNVQRNILTLMARINASHFDAQSKVFETRMCDDLIRASEKWKKKAANKTFKIGAAKEEIDIIIVDEEHRTILALEARWMLQPGDPREVINRVDACNQKVAQISRKVGFLKQNIAAILNDSFSISEPGDSWTVLGAVVIEGFGGKLSLHPDLPIISIEAIKVGLHSFSDIRVLHYWIKSLEWLPQPEIHFSNQINEISTPIARIEQPSFFITTDAPGYTQYLRASVQKASRACEENG